MIRHTLLSLMFLTAAISRPVRADEAALRALPSLLFNLRVTAQRYDPAQPWKKGAPERRTGYAVAVTSNLLLTVGTLVRDHTLVEASQAGSARFEAIRVLRADRDLNLALLDVSGSAFAGLPRPLEIAGLPFPGSQAALYQFEEGGVPQQGSAQILRAVMEAPDETVAPLLALRFLGDIPVNGAGVPVLQNGFLAGLVVSYDAASRIGLLYPGRTLSRFIRDAATPDYAGVALAGFVWQSLPDPVMRRYLKAPPGDQGVQIVQVLTNSGAAALFRTGDVLLEWGGFALDHQGYYRDDILGRLPFTSLVGSAAPGDAVPVSFARDGVVTQAAVRLTARAALPRRMPHVDDGPPPFLVEGGLIIRDLSGDYLRASGGDWLLRANARLVRLFLSQGEEPALNGERLPILTAVLPDIVNIGYQEIRDAVITQVNGEPVQSLADILRIRQRDGALARIRLSHLDVELAFDPAVLPAANARIAENYRVPVFE